MITSRHNQRIKDAAHLRDRRHRAKRGQFLIEGVREVQRALDGGVEIVEVFVAPDLVTGGPAHDLLARLERAGVPRHDVTPEVFAKLAYGERSEGVIALARIVPRSLDALMLPPEPLVAVLEGVEKPGNLGAIARTADAAGVAALVLAGRGTDIYNPNAIRASLGTLFTVQVALGESESALAWARSLEIPIFAARPDAHTLYTAADLSRGAILVLGSEAAGLSNVWHDPTVTPIRLPMHGAADSLNVSTTAAVLFYEALRQRQGMLQHPS